MSDEPQPEITEWNKDKKSSVAYIENMMIGQKPLKVGYLDEPDNRLSYDFVALDKIVDDKNKGEIPITSIDARKIDYPVKIEDREVLKRLNEPKLAFVPETKNKDAYPLSFLSIKEGEVEATSLDSDKIINEMQSSDYENAVEVFDSYFGKFVILLRNEI